MKIKYEFLTGEVSEIEVDAELGALLLDLDRKEYNNDHAETRRHSSLDGMDYEGGIFASAADTAAEAELCTDLEALGRAIESLTPQQKELVKKVYFEGRSYSSIAHEEGVAKQSVHERMQRIVKKLKLFFN